MPRGRPRKLARLEVQLLIRVTPEEKLAFQRAADYSGISLSAWIRERLRLAVLRDLSDTGVRVGFLDREAE